MVRSFGFLLGFACLALSAPIMAADSNISDLERNERHVLPSISPHYLQKMVAFDILTGRMPISGQPILLRFTPKSS